MVRNLLRAQTRIPHVSVLVAYRDAEGRQLPLPAAQTRESFTGLQLLTQRVLGFASDSLAGYTQDFTIMQTGPSTFRIEVRAFSTRSSLLPGRRVTLQNLAVTAVMDHLTDVITSVGAAGVYLANHPTVQARYVEDGFGSYYELFTRNRTALAVEAGPLEKLLTDEGMAVLRALVANLKQPGLAYATLTRHTPGLRYVRRAQVATSDALRRFAAGEPLPLTSEDLAAARERARAEAPSSPGGQDVTREITDETP